MSKNKYNIEEVFKSELEDFEMEVPQNGWTHVSNNIANASKVAKTSFWGSSAFTIATIIGTSIAIATGVIIYSNTIAKENQVNSSSKQESKIEQVVQLNKEIEEVNSSSPLIEEKITELKEIKPTTIFDPVIEKIEKSKNTKRKSTKQYIIKNNISAIENNSLNENDKNETSLVAKKPIKPIITEKTSSINDIEIIEIEATEIVASISASPVGGFAPLSVEFWHQNESTTTLWDFKDGSFSKEKESSHTFEKEGQYEVELTLTNERGNMKKVTKTINVLGTSSISNIPNIFTPNNDGINDKFIVKHENITSFNLYIYNKSGKLVFESNEIEQGWDGNTSYNEKAEAGNYIYNIKAKGTDGKDFEESGVLKLAR